MSHIKPEALARAGFDLHEGFARGRGGRMTIVATPRQAAALRRRGARVTAPYGTARTLAAAPSPLKDPTHGYDVFRPWSLEPAPCPTTCATPNIPLRDWYHQLARRNRDIVKEVVYGHSLLGQPLIAYKVTRNARRERNGRRPAVLYNSTQHAREWIAAEVERRLFAWFLSHRRDASIRRLLGTRELWFVPIVNPDGYDYTFVSKATRMWRKNLRDNNGDGQITNVDGVDTNRNWPTKWNWDNEGASNDPADETYRGKAPASEPEVRAMSRLERRIRARFQIDYHSFAQLILYPEGWQVETPAADTPLNAALAGDDDHPAVAGFDPDVSAELYTTNGDVTDDALKRFRTEATTVELDGGTGPGVGGTVEGPDSFAPGGFVFQDSEAAVQAEFDKNLDYALDLARTAGHPDRPSSHLGNTAPDFVPTTFPTSYGSPQTVEVDAKRSLGPVRAFWQVGSGRIRSARTRAYPGGERYGEPGVYYHRLRAQVRGPKPGDSVKVWFAARGRRSASFTYTVKSDTGNPVLLMVAEDYTGNSSALGTSPYPGPRYRDTYAKALQDAGARYDVYDVDAEGRTAPSYLGVLSHYRAVIWETGEDLYTREPGQPGGTGVSKLLDDEVIGARDYLNDGGKLLVAGKYALQGGWGPVHLNPLGAPPHSFCNTNQATGNGDADDPPGQAYNCVLVSNDFQQYWLGAYLATTAADSTQAAAALPFLEAGGRFGTQAFTLNGADSAANQDNVYSFLTTSSILKPDAYPQFASEQAIKFNRPPAFDPPTGSAYAFSQSANQSYKRLTRTVDLTGRSSGSLSFKLSYNTEPGYDFVFVEAHTVGQDDWTTLPDANGHTSDDTGLGCPDPDPFWLNTHPFLRHYITRSGTTDITCTPHGTSGAWNAATGNSGGFQDWRVDLGAYAGKQVEVSITYETDPATLGLGAFVDDATVTVDGATVAATSFETDLGGWSVPGPPPGSPGNPNDWIRTASVGYVDGPGVATSRSLYWGFGLEGVTGAATRAQLVKDALGYLAGG